MILFINFEIWGKIKNSIQQLFENQKLELLAIFTFSPNYVDNAGKQVKYLKILSKTFDFFSELPLSLGLIWR